MSRFDYVKYDKHAIMDQNVFKGMLTDLETQIESRLPDGRAKSLILTKLEEAYMWMGKAIRDEQISRNGSAELQEERNDG